MITHEVIEALEKNHDTTIMKNMLKKQLHTCKLKCT